MNATSRPAVGVAGWVLLSFAAAAVGGVASANAGDFYQRLARPGWAPPPYLAWVSYAAALTYAVWRLNPEILG